MRIYTPENFVPSQVLPPDLLKYSEDARYFLFKIFEQRLFNFRKKSDFIPIKCAYIRKILSERNYRKIKDSLIYHNVIETDNNWIKGHKSMGYRFTMQYAYDPFVKYSLTSKRLIKNITNYQNKEQTKISSDVHKFLYENLTKIHIDYDKAILKSNNEANKISIELIKEKQWFFKNDEYGRVHTNITNLKSNLREHLKVNNENLIEIDIVNSQPLFLCLLAESFISNNNKLINFNINNHSLPFSSLRCDILKSDFYFYKELVENGELYEYLSNAMGLNTIERKQVKVKLFTEVFFGKHFNTLFCKEFAHYFPSIYRVIQEIKRKDYANLARILQKVESIFVINKIVRKLMDYNRFVTTIHDSFLTTIENKEYLIQAIEQEFAQWGYMPKLKIKNVEQ